MKRIFCLLLVMVMTGIFGVSAQEEGWSVYLNGEKQTFTAEDSTLRFIDIAGLLGYETVYDEETRTVRSAKDDTVISYSVDDEENQEIRIEKSGEEAEAIPYGFYISEGVTYVSVWDTEQIFGIKGLSNWTEEEVHLYDMEVMQAAFRENAALYIAMAEQGTASVNQTIHAEGALHISADSPLFGVAAGGGVDADVQYRQNGEAAHLSLSLNPQGLGNLIEFALLEDSEAADMAIDLDKPMTGEFYFDKEGVYTRSEIFGPMMVSSAVYWWSVDEDFKQETLKTAKEKWLMTEYADDQLPYGLPWSEQAQEPDADQFVTTMTELIVESVGSEGYDQVIKMMKLFDELITKYVEPIEKDGKIGMRFAMTKEDFKEQILAFGEFDEEEKAEFEKTFEVFSLSLSAESVADETGSGSFDFRLEFGMDNIPNDWQLQMMTISAELTMSGDISTAEVEEIPAPAAEDIIPLDEIVEGVENHREPEEDLFLPESIPDIIL